MIHRGLLFGGLGLLCWGIGGMIWMYYTIFQNIVLPYPSVTDIFYLPSTLFYSLGVIYFARASGSELKFKNTPERLFVVTSTVIISIISYYFLVTIARGGKLFDSEYSPLENFLNIAYPCMDFVGLTIAVLVSGLSFKYIIPKYKIALMALTCGLVIMFISDSLLNYLIIHGKYYNGCLSDLSFVFGVSLLIFGVLGFCSEREKQTEHKIHAFEFLKYR